MGIVGEKKIPWSNNFQKHEVKQNEIGLASLRLCDKYYKIIMCIVKLENGKCYFPIKKMFFSLQSILKDQQNHCPFLLSVIISTYCVSNSALSANVL